MTSTLPEETRRELFYALVSIQDEGASVEVSRKRIAGQFLTAVEDVRDIEREGIAKQWPPLGNGD